MRTSAVQSWKPLKSLVGFQRDGPKICRIREFVGGGIDDQEWVPKLRAEGWVVISADRGKQCGGAKLPQVCAAHEVTHVLLSSALHQMQQFEKMRAILSCWPQLCQLHQEPNGTRFRLRLSQDRNKAILEPFKKPTGTTARDNKKVE